MANKKITDYTADTAPASGDLVETVDVSDTTYAATGTNKKVTATNLITKAHGLSDGVAKVSSSVLTTASQIAATEYPTMVGDSGAGGTKGAVPAPAAGDTAASKFLKADGSWAVPAGAGDMVLAGVQTVTGAKTFGSAGAVGKLKIAGTTSGATTVDTDAVAGTAVVTIPAVTDTLVGKATTDTLTNKTIDANGTGNSISNLETADFASGVVDTDGTLAGNSDTKLASQKAVKTYADTKQPLDSDLTTIAGLTATTNNIIQSSASAWASRTPTQVTATLDAVVGDSGSGGTKGLVPAPGAGDAAAGKYLKADGTWATAGGSGQTLVTKIVASSGGDYTTLGAAVAAASAGWTIWVKSSTTESGATTSALNSITIIGMNPEDTVVTTGGTITFSGTNVRIENLGFSLGHNLVISGDYHEVLGCHFTRTAANYLSCTGKRGKVRFNKWKDSQANTCLSSTGAHCNIEGNTFDVKGGEGDTITVSGGMVSVSNNTIYYSGGLTSAAYAIRFNSSGVCSNNTIDNSATSSAYCRGIASFSGQAELVGNTLLQVADYGINVIGNNQNITGNYLYTGNSSSSAINFASNSNFSNIVGNTLKGASGGHGIHLNSATFKYGSITGNNFQTSTTGINGSSAGAMDGTTIEGNAFDVAVTTIYSGTLAGANVGVNGGMPVQMQQSNYYMKNTSGATINAGNLVTWKAVAAANEVTTTTTAGDDKVFGVATAAITNNSSGFIQVLGKTTLLTVDGTTDIAVGDPLTSFTTAGIAAKAAAGDMVFAYALEAYTTNDSNGVIDALLITPRLI